MTKKTVVIGLAGPTLDARGGKDRWQRWRPTVSIGQHDDLLVDRFELLCQEKYQWLGEQLATDFKQVSPDTEVNIHLAKFPKPWDFGAVYAELLDFAKHYPFDPENEDYLVHITTGTHVIQICLFLLVESRIIPARLLQTSCPERRDIAGKFDIIDLDLSKYDQLAERFTLERKEAHHFLKAGIDTRNAAYNRMIEEITRVCERSKDPILLTGPSGVGKTRLARLIYEWKKKNGQVSGAFVELNCATLRGDAAMSALFGHKKGAYTGAAENRAGLLAAADGGLLFLDEVGELGADEQAMLLRAIEEKKFYPMGSDTESTSDFQLICGTNRDLAEEVRQGRFRLDLLSRINMWHFRLPALRERLEDIEPNINYELDRHTRLKGFKADFLPEARERYLNFAMSPEAIWPGNFRDLSSSIERMQSYALGGIINEELVEEEIIRLRAIWHTPALAELPAPKQGAPLLSRLFTPSQLDQMDLFDKIQLENVIRVCCDCSTRTEAGRKLFGVSRGRKKHADDTTRLNKYLKSQGVTWEQIQSLRYR